MIKSKWASVSWGFICGAFSKCSLASLRSPRAEGANGQCIGALRHCWDPGRERPALPSGRHRCCPASREHTPSLIEAPPGKAPARKHGGNPQWRHPLDRVLAVPFQGPAAPSYRQDLPVTLPRLRARLNATFRLGERNARCEFSPPSNHRGGWPHRQRLKAAAKTRIDVWA